MIIQINTDKTIIGDKKAMDYFTSQISDALSRFNNYITRIEIHLKDLNGKKDGFNDISCLLEARIKGSSPIAVSSQADTIELAISAAINKIKSALNSLLGKIQQQ